jgi:(R,R)-butanediol dehydrogenase/meso-butanediol dehydrogenase/diacetyl reductase
MRALVLKTINELEFVPDFPKPTLVKDEVLIKVKYCGICGSDLEAFQYGKVLMPLILGHEFSGEIVEIGPSVTEWQEGDRVTVYPGAFCGKCHFCERGEENLCKKILIGLGISINGAMAEYVKFPAKFLCKLPDSVSFEEGAIVEPLAVGYHGVKLSNIQPGDTAVVIGAGTIGISTIQALKLFNIEDIYVIEPVEFNHNIALQLGAKQTKSPIQLNKIGPDFVFVCAGFPETYNNAIKIVRNGGSIILLGVHFDPVAISFLQVISKEANLRGSFGYSFTEFKEVLLLLEQGKFQPELLISKKVKLENAVQEGFLELLSKEKRVVKILVEL